MSAIDKTEISTSTAPSIDQPTTPMEDIVAPYYLRVTGKNISPDRPVSILGVQHDRPVEKYPTSVLQTLKNRELLVSEFPIRLLGDTPKIIKQINARVHREIQQKFEAMDEPWFRAKMTLLGFSTEQQTEYLKMLKEKRALNLQNWHIELPLKAQQNIQKHLDDYGLTLQELHPLIAETMLDHKIRTRNYKKGIEPAILEHFQQQMRPVIELDDRELIEADFIEGFLEFLEIFDLEDTLETMQHYCEELDTGEYSDEEDGLSDINDAYADRKLRLNLDRFKMEEEEIQSVRARNLSWQPKLLSAIGQNRSTAIVMGYEHLNDRTGAIQFLESEGYTVELAY